MSKIYPRCKKDMAGIYINAQGYVFPCCWIATQSEWRNWVDFYKEQTAELNLNKNSLDKIVRSDVFLKIENSWQSRYPLPSCVKFCGKKEPEEIEKMRGNNREEIIILK